MFFSTSGRRVVAEIEIDDDKVISKVKFISGKEIYERKRNEGIIFDTLLERCYVSMMKDGLSEFKRLLKEIKDTDDRYFKIGKEMLDKEAARYMLD